MHLVGIAFERIGSLAVARTERGEPLEFATEVPAGVRRNGHGEGPFCRFSLPAAPSASGVYALVVQGTVVYVGETVDLAQRFGASGYGQIQPRNCHADGQSTNCKVNRSVLQATKQGEDCMVWFHEASSTRKAIEAKLVKELAPPWNAVRNQISPPSSDCPVLGSDRHTASSAFGNALERLLLDAQGAGRRCLRVSANELHRRVGGYPGRSHRMPACCAAMRKAMRDGDFVVDAPAKGTGPSLTIQYRLPRI